MTAPTRRTDAELIAHFNTGEQRIIQLRAERRAAVMANDPEAREVADEKIAAVIAERVAFATGQTAFEAKYDALPRPFKRGDVLVVAGVVATVVNVAPLAREVELRFDQFGGKSDWYSFDEVTVAS